MKRICLILLSIVLIIPGTYFPLWAQDMRELQINAQKAKEALMQKSAEEKKAAEKEAAESRGKIIADQTALENSIAQLEAANRNLKTKVNGLAEELEYLNQQEQEVTEKLAQTDSMVKELVGVIRVNAKDIDTLINQNLQTALTDTPNAFLEAVAEESQFPGMQDIRNMAKALINQSHRSAEVRLKKGNIIDRSGHERQADLLLVGPFTAAYRIGDEIGFCNYSSAGHNLYALSRLPSGRMQGQIADYMEGKSDTVPMDISRGGALRQLTHELKLLEQIPHGGPIVWPILLILVVGILITIERIIFLFRKYFDSDDLIRRIETLSAEKNWKACEQRCDQQKAKPVARVIKAGLNCCDMQREDMESALQEAILKEIPPMERFLSTLGMLAAIAPLMGLLGTVTGMIDTFHVITLHGTGDPRLMSGGISEALITTMMGLTVAIPLMLSQTLLNRAVDKRIGEMEEKAVALVNIIHKNRVMG